MFALSPLEVVFTSGSQMRVEQLRMSSWVTCMCFQRRDLLAPLFLRILYQASF